MCHKDVGCGIGFAVSPSRAAAAVSVTFRSCQNLLCFPLPATTPHPLTQYASLFGDSKRKKSPPFPLPQCSQKLFPNASSISDLRGRLDAASSCNLCTTC